MAPPINIIKKICLLGDPAVGKTSLIQRFVYDTFSEDYKPTIGTKVVKKKLLLDMGPERPQKVSLTLLIFDILGQARFERVHRTYYVGAEGGLLVADLSREETVESLSGWKERFMKVVGDTPMVLIGNKEDLVSPDEPAKERLRTMASSEDVGHLFTSAKTGEGVEKAFRTLGKAVLSKWPP